MIHMVIVWWDHKPGSFEPDYDRKYTVTIVEATPADCMAQYRLIQDNHDLVKFTPTQILMIY